ncbi:MAG: HAMP domain-containing histidine kinase [Hyphomicrobiaceae bacterium]|nr:HAMP domain-containing histidine kinase [Hyphomicrobiaceae bacterium]
MTVPAMSRDVPDQMELDLARLGPAIVVAPDEARLVAANADGAMALGIGTAPLSELPVDSAMPAISRLRQIAAAYDAAEHMPARQDASRLANGAGRMRADTECFGGSSIEPLVFWTMGGVVKLSCRVRALAPRAGRRMLLVEPIMAVRGDGCAGHGNSFAEPPPPRDDAETLRAIARQILGDKILGGGILGDGLAPGMATRIAATADAPADGGGGGATGSGGGQGAGGGDGGDNGGRDARHHRPAAAAPRDGDEGVGSAQGADASSTGHAASPPDEAASRNDDLARGGAARRNLVRQIAHELKTPLSAIVSAAEIMKDERFGPIGDERYLRYSRDIHESARHLLDVVERMLEMKATPAAADGSTTYDFVEVDLQKLVAATLSTVDVIAREAGVAIVPALGAQLPSVVADTTSLRQIVINLVTNALKFTPRGGTVTVACRAILDGPLILEVVDDGPGITDDEIDRILAADTNGPLTPRKGGGFGIGLPLVKTLATANGGTLEIGRGASGGAVVRIVFPKSRLIPR